MTAAPRCSERTSTTSTTIRGRGSLTGGDGLPPRSARCSSRISSRLPTKQRMSDVCPVCLKQPDGSDGWGGPDPCLGLLPGVISACCGHGCSTPYGPYLFMDAGVKYAGLEAIEMMRELGGNPPAGSYISCPIGVLSDVSRERALNP